MSLAAVPLIVAGPSGYALHEAGAALLAGLRRKVAVLVVCGKYRTGKSFLLNQLMATKNAFSVGNTVESHTRGLWVCAPGITSTTAAGEEVDVVFLDSEGLASTDKVRLAPLGLSLSVLHAPAHTL
jgi:hypothetical protein